MDKDFKLNDSQISKVSGGESDTVKRLKARSWGYSYCKYDQAWLKYTKHETGKTAHAGASDVYRNCETYTCSKCGQDTYWYNSDMYVGDYALETPSADFNLNDMINGTL